MTNINIQLFPKKKKCIISTKDNQQKEYFYEDNTDLLIALDAFITKYPVKEED